MNKLLLGLILIFTVFFYGCTVSDSEVNTSFTIAFIPSENATELSPKAEALADFLEARLGMEVEIIIPTEYEALIEGLRFGHIDASYMDSGPAWIAYQKTGAEVVLAELKDNEPFYYGEIWVKSTNEEIKSLSDLLGKKIAFTSWTGSSGFIFPIGKMVDEGLITPSEEDFIALEKAVNESFESYIVSGGYKQSLDLLLKNKVDVIAGPHDLAQRFLEEQDQDQIKSILRLGKVPSHPIMIRSDLDPQIADKFISAMLELNQPENLHIIENLYGVTGLQETNSLEHLGDFGPIFAKLTGIQKKVFIKHQSS